MSKNMMLASEPSGGTRDNFLRSGQPHCNLKAAIVWKRTEGEHVKSNNDARFDGPVSSVIVWLSRVYHKNDASGFKGPAPFLLESYE